MEKDYQLGFLASKKRTLITQETVKKIETWAFFILSFWLVGTLASIASEKGRSFLFGAKMFSLTLLHAGLFTYLASTFFLHASKKAFKLFFKINDFLVFTLWSAGVFVSAVAFLMISHQLRVDASDLRVSWLFVFTVWTNYLLTWGYFLLGIFGFLGFHFWPGLVLKTQETLAKGKYAFLSVHGALAVLFLFTFQELEPIGSGPYFTYLYGAGVCLLTVFSILFLITKFLQPSYLKRLDILESQLLSGQIKNEEEFWKSLRDLFVSERWQGWFRQSSLYSARKTHDMMSAVHQSISLVETKEASQIDVHLIEAAYQKSQKIYRQLERQYKRYLLVLSWIALEESATSQAENLKAQWEKDLRKAQLELFSVRKSIDEKIMTFKSQPLPLPAVKKEIEELPLNS